jgi:hypothetical protein
VVRGDHNSDDATLQEEVPGSLAQGAVGSGANAQGCNWGHCRVRGC